MMGDTATRNLLEETTNVIKYYGHTIDDVQFVVANNERWPGERHQWSTWEEFAACADVTYDSGFGGAEVNETLKIVGNDWWLERHEYDGSEWWEYKLLPARPDSHEATIRVLEYD